MVLILRFEGNIRILRISQLTRPSNIGGFQAKLSAAPAGVAFSKSLLVSVPRSTVAITGVPWGAGDLLTSRLQTLKIYVLENLCLIYAMVGCYINLPFVILTQKKSHNVLYFISGRENLLKVY
jgi:hypothetical protein